MCFSSATMNSSESMQKLSSEAQLEFYKEGSSFANIVTENKHRLFDRFGEFQINGVYCDVVIISSDNVIFKVSYIDLYQDCLQWFLKTAMLVI